MIAFLGMYDRPETSGANDRFWTLIQTAYGDGPETLDRTTNPWDIWTSPDLLLAQTCGMPYRTQLAGKVALVGTPDYGFDGLPQGHYCSVVVAHNRNQGQSLSQLATGTFAYNEPLSQSGWAAPATHCRDEGITLATKLQTGAHRASAQAVADGSADFASLDLLTWQMIQRYDPFAQDLIVVTRTRPTPTLPYITAPTRDAERLFRAVSRAIKSLSEVDRETLGLRGVISIPESTYLAVPTPPAP